MSRLISSMEFIEIILQNSDLKEAKLYKAAQKAAANPEIGITIQNKAAYHVIKDCATIASSYLPLFVFGTYQSPFESLKGKFKKENIAEFIKQSEKDLSCKQLLLIILDKAEKALPQQTQKFETETIADPYGDYGSDYGTGKSSTSNVVTPLDILCNAFSVKA